MNLNRLLFCGTVTCNKSVYRLGYQVFDKYLSVWTNKFTCPCFVLCPHKLHRKGNEYCNICCGESNIMYGWDIVEGRDHPIPLGRPEFVTSLNMNTVGLMLWLTRELRSTGNAVIMDIGFYVLKVWLEMRRRGLYESEFIKRGNIVLRGFIDMALTITSGQKALVMWNILVVNGMRQSLTFLF